MQEPITEIEKSYYNLFANLADELVTTGYPLSKANFSRVEKRRYIKRCKDLLNVATKEIWEIEKLELDQAINAWDTFNDSLTEKFRKAGDVFVNANQDPARNAWEHTTNLDTLNAGVTRFEGSGDI